MMTQTTSFFMVFLAIFLAGMIILRTGLLQFSGDRIQTVMKEATRTSLRAFLVGVVVTALLQSSSAVMILTIGLIAAGHLSFKQSIGIILGTNIGTTFTTEMITFDIGDMVLPFLLIGAVLLFTRHLYSFSIGAVLFGLGCIFTAMGGFEQLSPALASARFVQDLIASADQYRLIGVGVGTLLTVIIQSSTATTGIIMGFMNENLLTLSAGIAIVLGANIGTCITAYLASIGGNKEARLAAYTHIWINVFSVLLFFPFIDSLNKFIPFLALEPDVQIAHVSLIINVISSLALLPFTGILSILMVKIHGKPPASI